MQQVGGSLGLSILVTAFGTAPPEAQAQFQQTGQLPTPWADQVLAHAISTSFQLAVVFATLALAVALTVVPTRTPQEVPVESS
jgi:hypothetical protein